MSDLQFQLVLTNALNRFWIGTEGLAHLMPAQARPYFFGAMLLALEKRDHSLRPVACGDVFRRLAAKLVLLRVPPAVVKILEEAHQIAINSR